MNVNSTNLTQQNYLNAYQNAQDNGYGKKLNTIIQSLAPKEQTDIKSLLATLDPAGKKDSIEKMAELDRSNMTVEDLVQAINEIFQPSQAATKSSYPSSFSMYV